MPSVAVLTRPDVELNVEGMETVNEQITLSFKDSARRTIYAGQDLNNIDVLAPFLDNETIRKYLVFIANFTDGTTEMKIFNEDQLSNGLLDALIELCGNAPGVPVWEILRTIIADTARQEGDTETADKYDAIEYATEEMKKLAAKLKAENGQA